MAIAPWGTAKRWKEPAGTKAKIMALLRANMESAPTEIGSAVRIDRNTESAGNNRFSVGEGLAPPDHPIK